jgi:ribosomal protein S27AE
MFTVAERNEAPFESAQGELPFAVRVGDLLRFVDLAGNDGRVATLHYTRGGGAHAVFMGVEVQRAQLAIESVAGERKGGAVATQNLQCPNCGGALPARADPNSQRVVCPYCNALSDLAAHTVIARQEQARASLAIPLGARGTLSGVAWVVIGYVERATWFDNERFTWSEYLLYSPDAGYRWLILDEGNWLFATPVSAGDVQVAPTQTHALFRGVNYASRNTGSASVARVLGEFYWKVAVGETVQTQDFVNGSAVLSREGDAAEVQWTFSTPIPEEALFRAFGLPPPVRIALPMASWSGDNGSFQSGSPLSTWMVIGAVLAALLCCMMITDDDGSGLGGGHGGVTFGGFGGK